MSKAAKSGVKRCAIYTRKSSEEGLEQDFNSLDAQREACESYIKSQAGEGWTLWPAAYDDGGYSGGTMERPGLSSLLSDIRSGKIDVVAVYKVDRLTRSLIDFAKIIAVFDARHVSFVSVTQSFNTTTSMGRLTLNMLLSFAQFEREVTGERIRDKIAASKKKGMWMGGHAPLGYDAIDRTLTINQKEAETVRKLFELYLKSSSVREVKAEADLLGLVTKVRKRSNGSLTGGRPFSRGHLYKIISNPIYAGMVPHKGSSFPGRHAAIIPPEDWDAVQRKRIEGAPAKGSSTRVTEPSLLSNKLFDEDSEPLVPSHAVKNGRRYRYYISKWLVHGRATDQTGRKSWRLPAREIESTIHLTIIELFNDPIRLANTLEDAGVGSTQLPHLLETVTSMVDPPIDLLVSAVLFDDRIELTLDLSRLTNMVGLRVTSVTRLRLKRRGVERKFVLAGQESGNRQPQHDAALIKAIARAKQWIELVHQGQSLREIAKSENVSDRYVSNLIPLAFLAPSIVDAIVSGHQPSHITLEGLTKRIRIPFDWSEQKTILGFC